MCLCVYVCVWTVCVCICVCVCVRVDCVCVCLCFQDEAKFSLQDIWASLLEGLPPQNHRYRLRTYPNSFIAHDVVEWLMKNHHASAR